MGLKMGMINIGNLTYNETNFVPVIGGVTRININDVMKDICLQINEKIIICLLLIFTFYVFSNYILPITKSILNYTKLNKYNKIIHDRLYSLLETLSLMSISLTLIFSWIQGIKLYYKLWIVSIICFCVFVNVINYILNKRLKKLQYSE